MSKGEIICKCRCKCRVQVPDKLCKCLYRSNECFHIIAVKNATGNKNGHLRMKTQSLIESKRASALERKGGKKQPRQADYSPSKKRKIDEDHKDVSPSKRKLRTNSAIPQFTIGNI